MSVKGEVNKMTYKNDFFFLFALSFFAMLEWFREQEEWDSKWEREGRGEKRGENESTLSLLWRPESVWRSVVKPFASLAYQLKLL